MVEEHFSLREMEKRKREMHGKNQTTTLHHEEINKTVPPPSHLPAGEEIQEEEMVDLRHYLDVILHRKWIVIFVSITIMLSALYKSYKVQPTYIAKTQILVKEESGGGFSSLAARMGFGGMAHGSSIETLAVISKTTPLLKKIIEDQSLNLSTTDLSEMIEVKPNLNTNILDITVTVPEETMALVLANTFARSFIEYISGINRSEADNAHEVLANQLEKTKYELAKIEENIKKFIDKEGIISVGAEISAKTRQMSSLENTLRDLEAQIIGKEQEKSQIKKRLKSEAASLVTETKAPRPLQQQLINLEMELATTRTRRTEKHPEIKAIKNNINAIKKLIRQKLEESVKVETFGRNPLRDNLLSRLANIEATMAALNAKREAIIKLRERLSVDMDKLPDQQIRFAKLERQKKSIENIYIELQRRFQESRLMKEIKEGNLYHLQPAEEAEPVERNIRQSGILGLIVGLSLGIGLAFFLEYLDNTIKTSRQIRDILGLNTLGLIPFLPVGSRIIDPDDPKSALAEIYRHVMTNLRYTSFLYNQKIIMFTSTHRNEGTTTMCINSGLSAAMGGKSVLLIDSDLRRASLSKYFGVKRKGKKEEKEGREDQEGEKMFTAGLSDYLVDETELRDILQKTKFPRLFFIPAGTRVPNPAELLSSPKMDSMFKTLSKKFDVIFVDTPAILPIVDAVNISPLADAVLFLVAGREVPIEEAKNALARLKRANANIVGCIISKMKLRKDRYYDYYYDEADELKEEKAFWQMRTIFGGKTSPTSFILYGGIGGILALSLIIWILSTNSTPLQMAWENEIPSLKKNRGETLKEAPVSTHIKTPLEDRKIEVAKIEETTKEENPGTHAEASPLNKEKKNIEKILQSWTAAWESKDIEKYMAFYSKAFYTSKHDWESYRDYKKNLFNRPGNISVNISNIGVQWKSNSWIVSFIQKYHSDTLDSTRNKLISFQHENDGWKIIREITSKE